MPAKRQSPPPEVERVAYTIDELCSGSGRVAGRTKLYEEIAAGRLRARKLGRRTVILAADARAWLEALPVMESAGTSDEGAGL